MQRMYGNASGSYSQLQWIIGTPMRSSCRRRLTPGSALPAGLTARATGGTFPRPSAATRGAGRQCQSRATASPLGGPQRPPVCPALACASPSPPPACCHCHRRSCSTTWPGDLTASSCATLPLMRMLPAPADKLHPLHPCLGTCSTRVQTTTRARPPTCSSTSWTRSSPATSASCSGGRLRLGSLWRSLPDAAGDALRLTRQLKLYGGELLTAGPTPHRRLCVHTRTIPVTSALVPPLSCAQVLGHRPHLHPRALQQAGSPLP
jgi:hypothetical protein